MKPAGPVSALAKRPRLCLALSAVALAGGAFGGPPHVEPADDARHFGPPEAFLFWSAEQKVAGFRNIASILPTRVIAAGDAASPLPPAATPIEQLRFEANGEPLDIDGFMTHGPDGGELGGCCISATLRDYARIGLFALADGVLPNGERVLPEGWMAESISPAPGYAGYGYLWWLQAGGQFDALGIFGQSIHIDPARHLVVVTHSAWPTALGDEFDERRAAFLAALAQHLDAAS